MLRELFFTSPIRMPIFGEDRQTATTTGGFLDHLVKCFSIKWTVQKLAIQTRTTVKTIFSGVFWLHSHRTLCISNCSLPVRQEPAREGARSLVLSRRVPGGLPRNGEIRKVSKQAAGAEASACLKPVKMFSAECFHSDTSKVFGQKKNLTNFSSLLCLILLSTPL